MPFFMIQSTQYVVAMNGNLPDVEQVDIMFMQRVINEVQTSCALPFQIPISSVQSYIVQAAQYFWEVDNNSVEERSYLIKNKDICKCDRLNKLVKLPPQILGVHGVFKTNNIYGGVMGDFSMERIILNNYTFSFSAYGANNYNAQTGWRLQDVVTSLYEMSTYDELLNTPVTYNYNKFSNQLVLLGDLGSSDLIINCMQRCVIQDLYKSYWFFRWCVCLVKRGLSTIYGTLEFKLPGGVTINYSKFSDEAKDEMDKIEEYLQKQYCADYFFMSGTN